MPSKFSVVYKSDLFYLTFKVLHNMTPPYQPILTFQSDWLPHHSLLNTQDTHPHCSIVTSTASHMLLALAWNALLLQLHIQFLLILQGLDLVSSPPWTLLSLLQSSINIFSIPYDLSLQNICISLISCALDSFPWLGNKFGHKILVFVTNMIPNTFYLLSHFCLLSFK